MKHLYTTLVLLFFLTTGITAQNNPVIAYDSLSTESLGADDYGMKKYVMAFLKKGPNRNQSEQEAAELQQAHLENIKRMAQNGDLVLAGPFTDDGDIKGIYIFNVETIEEAKKLTETDPAVKAGRLIMELHTWYGTAALLKVNEIHNIIKTDEF
ncbi:YciI family protein [Mangrovivirga cuniculi]|uniref:YCII-related domain-containing protein n=1 Tax=Mangrovivirga cuniculi TaxID=2715131 RepID=A0A4D7JTZ7_9BACT|nr:YciI family protein [Mangrovivirga cuniculi]QCK14365.1 hypothetical protein DCC35_06220 [Mangrovivirga cuniculi]